MPGSVSRGSPVAEIRLTTDCDAPAMGRNTQLGRVPICSQVQCWDVPCPATRQVHLARSNNRHRSRLLPTEERKPAWRRACLAYRAKRTRRRSPLSSQCCHYRGKRRAPKLSAQSATPRNITRNGSGWCKRLVAARADPANYSRLVTATALPPLPQPRLRWRAS
jgi:hypothetical protein